MRAGKSRRCREAHDVCHVFPAGFDGFPNWMWRNEPTVRMVEALRMHNEELRVDEREREAAHGTLLEQCTTLYIVSHASLYIASRLPCVCR